MKENSSIKWVPDIKAVYASQLDELKFIFSQAEKRVKETADEGDRIYSKSITVVSISITLLTGLLGFILNNYENTPIRLACGVAGCFIFLIICSLWANINPSIYKSIGSYPKDLLKDKFYENLLGKTSEWHLFYSEIMMYQERIEINSSTNDIRNKRLSRVYKLLYLIPIVFVISYWGLTLFLSHLDLHFFCP